MRNSPGVYKKKLSKIIESVAMAIKKEKDIVVLIAKPESIINEIKAEERKNNSKNKFADGKED